MNRRTFLTAVSGFTTIASAGCVGGGGDGGDGTETATASPTETATAADKSEAQQEYPDYNWELLEDATPEFTTEITLRNQSFNPVIAKVPTGTVRFANKDSYEHSVTIPALGVDKSLSGGESMNVTVDSAGQYDYVCTFHPPSMLGRLIAVEETPTPAATQTPSPTTTDGGGGYY